MDSKTKLLLGAAAAAFASGPALAATPADQSRPTLIAASYSELLEPVPNAVEQLRASNAEAASRPAELIPVQYQDPRQHHHHNHDRAWYMQNGYYWNGGGWVLRPVSHHHHHHHNRYWYRQNGYYWNGGGWVLRRAHHHHHHHNNY